MRLWLIFVTICVKHSWCIYNINRHKGLPLVKAATDSAATVSGNEREGVTPSITEVSSKKPKGENGEVRVKAPVEELHQPLVTIDDQTIDAFNNLSSKKLIPNEVKEEHNAMAIFFEKMSMFQMIMQASLEAIINRVTSLEATIGTKTEESNDSGIDSKYKNEIFETTEMPLKNGKISRTPEGVETGNPPEPVSDPTDADCVKDPTNGDEEAPERFNVDNFVDDSNLEKRGIFIDSDEGNDASKSGLQYKASVNDIDLHVSDRRKNDIGSSLTAKGNTISSSSENKKNNFKTKSHRGRMNERKISHSSEKFDNNYRGHDEESLLDSYQNDYVSENLVNDMSDDLSQTSNVPFNPPFAPQESFDLSEKEQVYQPPPQTTNKFEPLNRTAFETDRSRENPRLEYQMMKLQRRSDHKIAPKGSDYDCLDDDGIDCPGVAENAEDDDDKTRKLDELTRKDNFQARSSSKENFDYDVELINIERAEKKLEELIRQTAMIGELQELLAILNNFKPGCPYNVPSVKVGERCYSIEFIHLSFNEARQFCKARGGTLAQEPLNGYIWPKITRAYPNHESKDLWVGAHDERGEGRYHFFNGEELSSSDNRWDANSPSYSGRPNCLSAYGKTGLSFKDYSCDKKQHFICEYHLVSFI